MRQNTGVCPFSVVPWVSSNPVFRFRILSVTQKSIVPTFIGRLSSTITPRVQMLSACRFHPFSVFLIRAVQPISQIASFSDNPLAPLENLAFLYTGTAAPVTRLPLAYNLFSVWSFCKGHALHTLITYQISVVLKRISPCKCVNGLIWLLLTILLFRKT